MRRETSACKLAGKAGTSSHRSVNELYRMHHSWYRDNLMLSHTRRVAFYARAVFAHAAPLTLSS